jgi:hypothetical protein
MARRCPQCRPRGLEVDDQSVLGRCLHRKIGWLLALENAIDVAGGTAILVTQIAPVGDQAAGADEVAEGVDRRQLVPDCERGDMVRPELTCRHNHPAVRAAGEFGNGVLDLPGIAQINRA